MAQPTALLPAPRTDEEIGDDLFVALSGARRIDDVGQGKDGFIRTLARKFIRNPQSTRRRNPRPGQTPVHVIRRKEGGVMNQPPGTTTVVTRGEEDIPPQQLTPVSVIFTQHFAPAGVVAQNQLPVAQQGESYTPQQLTAGTLIVQNEFDGTVPGWKTLREKLLEREIPTTSLQAKALEEVLVDNMPKAKKVQTPPANVVLAVEAELEEPEESFIRFFWGENGPTILSMVLAIALVLAGFFAVYLVFKAKNTTALPPERPPASVVLPTPGTQTESGTTYVCVFIYDGWQGGADVMLAEAANAFYQLPPEKVGDLWTIIKGRPAGANYPEITTVNDAWNSANAGDGVIVSLSQAELTTLGGTCSGTWEAKK